jgi:hypothetical protein
MEKSFVTWNIFFEKKLAKTYIVSLDEKIIDIKKRIAKDFFDNEYDSVFLENKTKRIYKDFGKLFFDKGMMPETNNNFCLREFTIENRVIDFEIYPNKINNTSVDTTKNEIHLNQNSYKSSSVNMNSDSNQYTNNKYQKQYNNQDILNKKNNNNFIYSDEDFPKLS